MKRVTNGDENDDCENSGEIIPAQQGH